jgi:hypothetical protein
MLTKLLRWPVPDQIKALLEKIDNEGAALDASSRRRIKELLSEDFLTRYEKSLLKHGLRKYKRAKALDDAMCIVLNQEDEKEAAREAYREKLIASINSSPRGVTTAMWNGTVPGQHAANTLQNTVYTDPRALYQSADVYK